MNRYPLWKYLLIAFTVVLAVIYSLPNLFGETPAVQVSTNRQSIIINSQTEAKVAAALKAANIPTDGMFVVVNSLKVRFKDAETQLKGRRLHYRFEPFGRQPGMDGENQCQSDVLGFGLARRCALHYAGGYESRDAENL